MCLDTSGRRVGTPSEIAKKIGSHYRMSARPAPEGHTEPHRRLSKPETKPSARPAPESHKEPYRRMSRPETKPSASPAPEGHAETYQRLSRLNPNPRTALARRQRVTRSHTGQAEPKPENNACPAPERRTTTRNARSVPCPEG